MRDKVGIAIPVSVQTIRSRENQAPPSHAEANTVQELYEPALQCMKRDNFWGVLFPPTVTQFGLREIILSRVLMYYALLDVVEMGGALVIGEPTQIQNQFIHKHMPLIESFPISQGWNLSNFFNRDKILKESIKTCVKVLEFSRGLSTVETNRMEGEHLRTLWFLVGANRRHIVDNIGVNGNHSIIFDGYEDVGEVARINALVENGRTLHAASRACANGVLTQSLIDSIIHLRRKYVSIVETKIGESAVILKTFHEKLQRREAGAVNHI
jgi:hypothetical protein